MLTIGTDSYVTVEEATAYVAQTYTTQEPNYTFWTALSSEEKEIYLRRALPYIENLPFRGKKASSTQKLCFPRYRESEISPEVKGAQVEYALSFSDNSPENNDLRKRILGLGITSISMGDTSETYGSFSYAYSHSSEVRAQSPNSILLLQKYLTGGFEICY